MMLLHHDYPSAASLHAVLVTHRLLDRGAIVAHHGIDVLGVDATLPATMGDLEDWERHRPALGDLGWEVGRPRLHPATLTAHAVERSCDPLDARAWREACYDAHWRRGLDLGATEVLLAAADQAGLDQAAVTAVVGNRAHRALVRRQMTAVRGEGVGGVPVLEVDGTKVSPFMPFDDLLSLALL